MRIEGAMVAMVTPLRADGSTDSEALARHIEFLIEGGVDGTFAASTVGEFVHLDLSQRHDLVRSAVKVCDGRIPVLAGATDLSPARVIEHCRRFRDAGAACAVIAPPYYYPMSQADILAHYRRISDAISLPFVLYHIPQCSNRMTVETMLSIIRTCGPVAIKNSNPDLTEMKALLKGLQGSDVTYLVGPDELLYTGLTLGAHGCISGMAGILPEAVREIIDAYRGGDAERARGVQEAIVDVLELADAIPFPAVFKWMLSLRGFDAGEPVLALSDETRGLMEKLRPTVAGKLDAILAGVGTGLA